MSLVASKVMVSALAVSKALAEIVKVLLSPPSSNKICPLLSFASSSPLSTILITAGSNNNDPFTPSAALRSTFPWKASCSSPETSIKPPSPELLPPRVVILPKNPVASSAQTITCPPLPSTRASALITELPSIKVRRARGTSPSPL